MSVKYLKFSLNLYQPLAIHSYVRLGHSKAEGFDLWVHLVYFGIFALIGFCLLVLSMCCTTKLCPSPTLSSVLSKMGESGGAIS
jgi:hypothetical protein